MRTGRVADKELVMAFLWSGGAVEATRAALLETLRGSCDKSCRGQARGQGGDWPLSCPGPGPLGPLHLETPQLSACHLSRPRHACKSAMAFCAALRLSYPLARGLMDDESYDPTRHPRTVLKSTPARRRAAPLRALKLLCPMCGLLRQPRASNPAHVPVQSWYVHMSHLDCSQVVSVHAYDVVEAGQVQRLQRPRAGGQEHAAPLGCRNGRSRAQQQQQQQRGGRQHGA